MTNPTATITIGSSTSDGSTRYHAGRISNLRIVKGTAVYTTSFTPIVPLTAISGTSLLLNAATSPTYLTDSSGNNFTSTPTGSPTFNAAGPTYLNPSVNYAFALHINTSTGSLEFRPNTYSTSIIASSSIFSLSTSGSATITSNPLSITNTTTSVSSLTGALLVAGGAGIRGDLWVGGNVYVLGNAVNDRANNLQVACL
jgi:hypothetical protein